MDDIYLDVDLKDDTQNLDIDLITNDILDLDLETGDVLDIDLRDGRPGGTDDYNMLRNKPSIEQKTLVGNKTLSDLGIQPEGPYPNEALSNGDIEDILNHFV